MSELKGVVPPVTPENVTTPLPANVKLLAPLIVVEKLMLEPVAVTSPVKDTAPVKPMGLAVVVKLSFKVIAPV